MNSLDLTQGTQEWRQARCGSLGASQVHDALARTKSGWGASRANVMATLIAERLTGLPAETYTNSAMQWGVDHESEAREAYEFMTNATVVQVGIIQHPEIAGTHCSPDGLVGDRGLVEIKAPNTATHIDTLLSGAVPSKYVTQAMWQMICTGRDWVDYCSYDPRLPANMSLFVKRVRFDSTLANDLQSEVKRFLAELDEKVTTLRKAYDIAEAA